MKHYIIYFINGSYKIIQSSINLIEDTDHLHFLGIDYHLVDYIVPLNKDIDQNDLKHRKILPDGNSIWNKHDLINEKIQMMTEKRSSLLQKLDVDFMISLEIANNKQTEIIKINKNFLRQLSCRTEMHHIHDCEKINKFNAFYNILNIEIIDPGYGCSESVPYVTISSPEETNDNYGLAAAANAIRGSKGELLSLSMTKLGCGYISEPTIKISGYEGENAKHPVLKAVIGNII
jgi:hypothetical protein